MSLIRNYVTDIKMATACGDIRKICMGDYGKKIFEQQYLSLDGRYRALTSMYGYKLAETIGI